MKLLRFMIRLLPLGLLLFAVWCDFNSNYAAIPQPKESANPLPLAGKFDPAKCGTITGRVAWNGGTPITPPFIYGVPNADGNFHVRMIPNPNRPAIDDKSGAVAGAVVFLRGIDPAQAKPWNLPPARVEMKDRGIFVVRGAATGRTGFVRRGESVEMVSKEPAYHVLRARGAAFFSLAFPDAEQPLSRTLDKPGRVELSSGAGYYWASADLFVVDHPYYAITDGDGGFTFEQVPEGAVEVAAWLPGWDYVDQQRD
ncbi:MAG TPA: hypothetical protein VGL71_11690, partial [Urbifossiella sp.]